jgi:hypothetical protein
MMITSLAFVVPAFLVAVLHRTRAFWVGGFVAIVIGFLAFAFGGAVVGALAVLAGIGLIVYGFVLLVVGAMLLRRHLEAQPEIPPAKVRR